MSLILEALRRSEAERKRGKAPSLLDGGPPTRMRERPRWPIALGGLSLGLLLAGGVAWWMQRQAPLVPMAPTPTPIPAVAAPATEPPAASPTPVAAPDTVPAPAPAPSPVAAQPPVVPPPADPAPIPALPNAPRPTTPAAAPLPPTVDPLRGPASGDLPINELPTATRAALPPLRLSMHVFNEDAAQRFAIVDGARLREGDALADVRVLEIRRDGLRLAWQGRTLWLPR